MTGSATVLDQRTLAGDLAWDARERRFLPCRDAETQPPLVADSFLVSDGEARGVRLHRRRFARGCRDAGLPAAAEPHVWAAFVDAVPRRGRWFPRIEVSARGPVVVRLRPAPERAGEAIGWPLAHGQSARVAPRRKGPDLNRSLAWREEARRHGADEAIILDDDGHVLEGACTSLLWWDADTLFTVPDDAPVLPGVTRALLLELAERRSVTVGRAVPRLGDLSEHEVWLTSALHGIRRVSAWAGTGAWAHDAGRAAGWQAALEALAEPLGEAS